MNLQALSAMDDCEHATGKALEQHVREHQTAKEVIREYLSGVYMDERHGDAAELIADLRSAGYHIVQVVQTGNMPWQNH